MAQAGKADRVDAFAARLLAWFDLHGRHDLPWQRNPTPYSVWVSEIMLQQTRAATVVAYYQRFLQRFSTVEALAAGELDEVLALWSGLGYYARARNLHRAARIVVVRHAGTVPATAEELSSLPGIGRSTAGAILALACGVRAPILDGNARRVLARFHAIDGWPGDAAVGRTLWTLAEAHTPEERVGAYTQAIMDLGATLCTRTRPACTVCPLTEDCGARRAGVQHRLPAPRPRRARPRKEVAVLVVQTAEPRVLLERRPDSGVWGGLYSLPELAAGDSGRMWCERHLGTRVLAERALAPIAHAFTHFDLDLHPFVLDIAAPRSAAHRADWLWHDPRREPGVGVAAPIGALLRSLHRRQEP